MKYSKTNPYENIKKPASSRKLGSTRKFVREHKGGIALGALGGLAALGGYKLFKAARAIPGRTFGTAKGVGLAVAERGIKKTPSMLRAMVESSGANIAEDIGKATGGQVKKLLDKGYDWLEAYLKKKTGLGTGAINDRIDELFLGYAKFVWRKVRGKELSGKEVSRLREMIHGKRFTSSIFADEAKFADMIEDAVSITGQSKGRSIFGPTIKGDRLNSKVTTINFGEMAPRATGKVKGRVVTSSKETFGSAKQTKQYSLSVTEQIAEQNASSSRITEMAYVLSKPEVFRLPISRRLSLYSNTYKELALANNSKITKQITNSIISHNDKELLAKAISLAKRDLKSATTFSTQAGKQVPISDMLREESIKRLDSILKLL